MTPRPAAFLDRDGTIIRDASYIGDPRDVELLPGAADAIRRLNEREIAVIVVTNQSGIARGLFGVEEYNAVRRRLADLLATHGARIDASYMCPHHPDVTGPCDCRKPGLAMYRQAIAEHQLAGEHSLFAGDRWRDVEPAGALGGVGILIDAESTPPEDRDRARRMGVEHVGSLGEAVDRFFATLPAVPLQP
jgi:histidinol-phosphate phosphatase family domain/HAD-superfamily hydrolase, subfamily IIIA